MVHVKSPEEIELQRQSALKVGETLAEVTKLLCAGVSLNTLNNRAEEYIADMGAIPSFKGYGGFPGALCLSPNEQVVHGMPSSYELKDGDIISIDCGVFLNGFHGDSAYTFMIGEVNTEVHELLSRTKFSLYHAISKVRANTRIGDIGNAVQEVTEDKYNYGVVRELVGHGVGKNLHEDPQIPNYGRKGHGKKLKAGTVIAIEPMINMGTREIDFHEDGWTVTTQDRKPSAHFEHTVAVGEKEADVLSSFDLIEAEEEKNNNITAVGKILLEN